jgi:pimeloyl-ACP methyl ester carboxylesterase
VRRIAPVLAVLLAVVFATAGCEARVRWVSPTSGNTPPTGPSSAGTVDWRPCQDQAAAELSQVPAGVRYDCGTLEVPADWSKPTAGTTFDLALIRVRGRQSGRIGSLVVNPGGPGVSGVDLAIGLSVDLPAEILQRFDIVGFDPRGVDRSDPLRCVGDAQEDQMFGSDPDPASQAQFDAWVALNQQIAAGCKAKYGDTLRLYSTEQAARDIDAIRAAVGDAKLTYLGYSYGTLLGAVYAQLFPTHARAMVLDGAVDPTATMVAGSESQAQGMEHAFDQFANWCVQRRCPAGADPRATLTGLLATARSAPVANKDGRSATAGWILTGVAEALYSSAEWPLLGDAIGDLGKGDPKKIFELADSYAFRSPDGHYTNLFDIFPTVECEDDPGNTTVAQARALQSQWRAKYPLFGTFEAVGMVSCAVWPPGRDPYPTGPAVGAAPIVVVGTVNDPATPYAQTQKLADMLGVGHVVTWEGQGHTAYPQTDCIRRAVDGYLIGLTVPAKGLTCPA